MALASSRGSSGMSRWTLRGFLGGTLLVICQASAPRETLDQTFESRHALSEISHAVTQTNDVPMKVPEKSEDGNANPDNNVVRWVHTAAIL